MVLSAWSCWLMWGTSMTPDKERSNRRGWDLLMDVVTAITFLAQWHPLIVPERSDLRPEYVNGPAKGSGRLF